jgi:hypothetical protein
MEKSTLTIIADDNSIYIAVDGKEAGDNSITYALAVRLARVGSLLLQMLGSDRIAHESGEVAEDRLNSLIKGGLH